MSPAGPSRRPSALVIPMGRVLRAGAVGAAIALPAAAVLCWLLAGAPGFWGALIGMAIAVGFLAVTVVVALATADKDVSVLGFWVLGSWLVKVALLIAILALLREATFYSRPALLVSLLAGTIGTLVLEAVIVTRTRVPYVEPRA